MSGSASGGGAAAVRALSEKEVESLTVAMVVAPGVYVRNRMFDLMSTKGAQRARTRASTVRGVLRQLARATAISVTSESRGGETMFVLRYRIAAVRLTRVVELTASELAALRVVAERAGIAALSSSEGDKAVVMHALARLLGDAPAASVRPGPPENAGADLAQLVRELSP